MGPTTPTADGIGRELAELRAAVATLAEAARRLDARATTLEHLLAALPPDPVPPASPVPPAPPAPPPGAVLPAGPRRGRARTRSQRPAPRGRHRSTGPGARRRAAGGVALGLVVALPWVLCVGCFAIAIGLLAVSTFG